MEASAADKTGRIDGIIYVRRYMNQQPISDDSVSPFCTNTLHNHANRIIEHASLSHWVAEYNLIVSSA